MAKGVKYDDNKLRYDLVPVDAMAEFVAVLTHGAAKYSPDNWKHVPELQDRYYAAALRHLEAFRSGEILDDESGKNHLAHAICCLFFKLQNQIENDNEKKSREQQGEVLPNSQQTTKTSSFALHKRGGKVRGVELARVDPTKFTEGHGFSFTTYVPTYKRRNK